MGSETKRLTAAVVDGRPGFVDGSGQVFAAPVREKRAEVWRKALTKKGYVLPGFEVQP